RRAPHDIARPQDDDLAAAGLHEPDSLGDVERLAERCECHAVRAHGVNRTTFIRALPGSWARATTSKYTSPVNHSDGPFTVGCLRTSSIGASLGSLCRGMRVRRR